MDHLIDILQCIQEDLRIADIADDQPRFWMKIRRYPLQMHGFREIIQQNDIVAVLDQSVCRVRSDESGSAGDEYFQNRTWITLIKGDYAD